MALQLKAQQPTVKVETYAKAPDVEDTFYATWKRYSRKEAKKHIETLNALQQRNASDEDWEKELRKHLISVEITDAEGKEHVLKGDDLKPLFDSTPYFIGLMQSAYDSLDNLKAEKARLGNLESLVATLLNVNSANQTKMP